MLWTSVRMDTETHANIYNDQQARGEGLSNIIHSHMCSRVILPSEVRQFSRSDSKMVPMLKQILGNG